MGQDDTQSLDTTLKMAVTELKHYIDGEVGGLKKYIDGGIGDLKQYVDDGLNDVKQYVDQRQHEGFEDMKQYVDTRLVNTETRLEAKLEVKVDDLDAKLTAQISELSLSIGDALDTSNRENQKMIQANTKRITKLEHQIVRA
jgi:hypothetical protein